MKSLEELRLAALEACSQACKQSPTVVDAILQLPEVVEYMRAVQTNGGEAFAQLRQAHVNNCPGNHDDASQPGIDLLAKTLEGLMNLPKKRPKKPPQ